MKKRLGFNPQLLKKVLSSYFEGIENKDFTKMKAATTADFMLYEDGEVLNNDSAVVNIKAHLPFTVKYKFKILKYMSTINRVTIMHIGNNKKIMKEHTNSKLSNILGGFTLLIMTVAAIALIYFLF
jgi:hypothetical protein